MEKLVSRRRSKVRICRMSYHRFWTISCRIKLNLVYPIYTSKKVWLAVVKLRRLCFNHSRLDFTTAKQTFSDVNFASTGFKLILHDTVQNIW